MVTENDEATDTMEKMEAHKKGVLHRAFSVFIFNEEGQMLLQKRAATKYHGAGLWSNACCSHPYLNETPQTGAERRLQEELGFSTTLKKVFHFIYKAAVENNLIEHEFDHVFFGRYNGSISFNKEEVAAVAYLDITELEQKIEEEPAKFTTWFRIVFPQIKQWWQKEYSAKTQNIEI